MTDGSGSFLVASSQGPGASSTVAQIDLGMALLIGLAIGVVPVVVASWPRFVALLSERRSGAGTPPAGLTPLAAGWLSGLNATDLLACGLMWVIAQTPNAQGDPDGDLMLESGAESFIRGGLCPPGSQLTDAREAAVQTLNATSPARYEVRVALAGLGARARDDAQNLGLAWDREIVRRLLLALAAAELLVGYFIDGPMMDPTLLVGGLITVWTALHVDARSWAGAMLTGHLRRLRSRLRTAALATGAIDSAVVRSLVPNARTAAETEVWVVAVGCRTGNLERAASRLRSLAHAAAGRPRIIRYTEAALDTGGRLTGTATSPLRASRPGRRGPNGAAPVIW